MFSTFYRSLLFVVLIHAVLFASEEAKELLSESLNVDNTLKRIELLEKAVQLDPQLTRAWQNLGSEYIANRQYAKAVEALDQAIRLNPDYSIAHYNRARAFEALGKLQEALGDYTKAIQLKPQIHFYYRARAELLNRGGHLELAEQDYSFAIQTSRKKDLDDYHNRGNIRYKQGKFLLAAQDFAEVARNRPEDVSVKMFLAICLRKAGQVADSLRLLVDLTNANPEHPGLRYNLGLAFKELGKYKDAQIAFQQTLALVENHSESYRELAYVLAAQGDPHSALQAYQHFIRLTSPKPSQLKDYAYLLYAGGHFAEAEKTFLAWEAKGPEEIDREIMLYLAKSAQGKKAAKEFAETLSSAQLSPFHIELTKMLIGQINPDDFLVWFEKFTKELPETERLEAAELRARCFVGEIYLFQRKVKEAREAVYPALEDADPDSPLTWLAARLQSRG